MSKKTEPNRRAYLALFIGLFSIGFAAILISLAQAPGTVSAFYRMAVASVLVALPFLSQSKKREKPLPAKGLKLALLGGLLFALDVAFWATGITISGAATPTLMANTAPIWVGLGAMLIFHERLKVLFWVGLLIAMFGALLVLGADFNRGGEFGLGTILGLMAAVFYGAYYLVTQQGRVYLNTLSYFWITTVTAAVVLLIMNLGLGQPLLGYDLKTYLAFLALGVIAQTLGWLTINYSQGFLPASIVAPTLLGQPVVTAILAVLLLGETFSPWHILGGVLVLVGVYIVHRSRWQETEEVVEPAAVSNGDEGQ
jgi:drug/metabolite transporter (DMT)-like permease